MGKLRGETGGCGWWHTDWGNWGLMMTGAREAQLMEAANLLLDARRTLTPMVELPKDLQPVTLDEAYVVNDVMSAGLRRDGWMEDWGSEPGGDAILWSDAEGVDLAERRSTLVRLRIGIEGWRRRLRFCWGRTCLRGIRLTRGTR